MIVRILVMALICWPLLSDAKDLSGTSTALRVDSAIAKEVLLPWANIIEDPSNLLTAEQILQNRTERVTLPEQEVASFGFSRSTFWLHVSIFNSEPSVLKTLLVVKPTWLDDVKIFQFTDGTKTYEAHGGDFRPFDLRPISNPNINFELSIPSGQSDLLIRVRSSDPVDVAVYLYQPEKFFKTEVGESQYMGIVLGVLGSLILYNLFLFPSTRDKVYIAYAIYLIAFLLIYLTLNGHSYQLFWPDSPTFNNFALAAVVHIYMLSGLLFAILFLELRTRLVTAYRLAIGFTSILTISYLTTAIWGYGANIFSATAWAVIYGPFVLTLGIYSWRAGNRAARFFLLGTMSGLVGSCITALTTSGILHFSFITYHAVDLGMMVDAVLLSFALADRISLIRQENDKAQAEIKLKDECWRLALESAGEGVWDWNVASGNVTYSKRWKEMLGFSANEIEDNFESWRSLVFPDDLPIARAHLQQVLSGAIQEYRNEFRMRCKNGRWKWILAQGAVVERDDAGNPVRMIGTHIDIDQMKRLEAEIKELNENLEERVAQRTRELAAAKSIAEKASQSKTRFLAAAGHDLRQPLAAANLYIDFLKYTNPTEGQMPIIQKTEQAMTAFTELLEALLNISKLDAGIIKPECRLISVRELFRWIDESFSSIAKDSGIDLKLHFEKCAGLVVYSDVDLIRSILQNLVSNAIKFTSRGAILVSVRKRGKFLLIQVWDTGIGISEQHVGQVFDEFYQVGNPQRNRTCGLGLGLSIAKRAALLLSSEISCRSQAGRGSVFSFTLPLSEPSDKDAETDRLHNEEFDEKYSRFIQQKSFVIVEDDALIADAMSSIINIMGGRANTFSTAESALAYALTMDADFYIVDYMLGGKLNGMQFLNKLSQEKGSDLTAVILTGDTSPDFVFDASNYKWPVLHKPVNIMRIVATLFNHAHNAPSRVDSRS